MKIRVSKLVVLVCLVIPCESWSMAFSEPPTREEKNKALAKSWNQPHTFYGKVVDLNGNPLEDVEVKASITSLTDFGTMDKNIRTVSTDKKGEFQVHFTGYIISICSVRKEFYENSRFVNRNNHINYTHSNHYETSKDKPLVFRLRKRLVPSYLIKKRFRFPDLTPEKKSIYGISIGGRALLSTWPGKDGRGADNETRPINDIRSKLIESLFPIDKNMLEAMRKDYRFIPQVLSRVIPSLNPAEKNDLDVIINHDIILESSSVGDSGKLLLKFLPLDEDIEFLLTDDLLYEAPADGYSSNVSLAIPPLKPFAREHRLNTYVYVRSKTGKYYSRVEIDATQESERVCLSAEVYTNPTGSRNLEYDMEYQSQERKRRRGISKRRRAAIRKIDEKRWAVMRECQEKRIKFDKEKFDRENKFDERKFMEKIRIEQTEDDKNRPLKWWDKLRKEKESEGE